MKKMGKWKKWILLALTLGLTATLAAACGGKGGGNNGEGGSSESSSVLGGESTGGESTGGESTGGESTDSGSSGGEEIHTHITDGEWKKNSTGHWLKCTCGQSVAYGSHTGEAETCGELPICTVCGKEFGEPKEHDYGALSDGEFGLAYYCDCGDYVTNADLVDFVVEVEEGRDPVVLQLSDTQIWSYGESPEQQCYQYVREVVEKTNPDLIILTGDIVYGKFDPNGTLLTGLISFMETLNTPWAPVFGNHDNESLMGVDWQCAQLEAAENCYFKQGDLTGNGNYTVGIEQGGELLRVFYMMDSNGCGSPMIDSNGNHTTPEAGTNEVRTTAGFASDQVLWYTNDITRIHSFDEDVKISMAYHIQQQIFKKAFEKYEEYDSTLAAGSNSALENPLNLDELETAAETDFGYIGRTLKGPWDNNNALFYKMKDLGVDSIFVGHEHCNSASIVYEGVRLQYGQKSSTYDRYNVLMPDGSIITNQDSGYAAGKALMGGTVIPISSEDGSIGTGYICYAGDPFGTESEDEGGGSSESGSTESDSTESGSTESGSTESGTEITVEGLQLGTHLTVLRENSVRAVTLSDGTNAYEYTAGSNFNKLYICEQSTACNKDALKGKTTVSFDILVPEVVTETDFLIRIKPNDLATEIGAQNGHLYFDESHGGDTHVTIGEWMTVTLDISAFADECTEFAIYLFAGQTVYVKNITVS